VKYLRNEKGNTMIFMLGMMSIMVLMFLLIGNLASVFASKEKASNIAQQASLVASSILREEIEDAIDEYERFVQSQEILVYPSLRDMINNRMNSMNSVLSEKEKRRQVTNDVLKAQIPVNPVLLEYIESAVIKAGSIIPSQVASNIRSNSGKVEGTEISISSDHRLQVTTHVRYQALKYDNYLSEKDRKVMQTGEGPEFDFLSVLWNKNLLFYKFPEQTD